MSESKITVEEKLLIERFASVFGFEKLSECLPGNIYPPYLYITAFIILDWGIINTYAHVAGDGTHVLLNSPQTVLMAVGLFLAVAGIRYFSTGYTNVVENLPLDEVDIDPTPFERIVDFRFKLAVYGVAVVGFYVYIITIIGLEGIAAADGTANLINWLFLFQVSYIPVMIEFGVLYFAVQLLLPRRISYADIPMFFYDTRNMGGFAPVGQLLKYSYYFYTAGLLLYFIKTFGPILFSFGGTTPAGSGPVEVLVFSVAWLIGVGSIGFSMYTMKRLMSNKKGQEIAEVEREIQEIIENPYDISESKISEADRYEDILLRRQEIRETRVYPASFTMWSQIGISVLLPQAMNIVVQSVG